MTTIKIIVTPKKSVLDPQGEAVKKALISLGLKKVHHVRVGKFIELEIQEPATSALEDRLKTLSYELLSNPVIEDYYMELELPENTVPKADYEDLTEPDKESESELVKLEVKPKKAVKKLVKAQKKAPSPAVPVKPGKGKKAKEAKAKPANKEIHDLSEARPARKKKATPST